MTDRHVLAALPLTVIEAITAYTETQRAAAGATDQATVTDAWRELHAAITTALAAAGATDPAAPIFGADVDSALSDYMAAAYLDAAQPGPDHRRARRIAERTLYAVIARRAAEATEPAPIPPAVTTAMAAHLDCEFRSAHCYKPFGYPAATRRALAEAITAALTEARGRTLEMPEPLADALGDWCRAASSAGMSVPGHGPAHQYRPASDAEAAAWYAIATRALHAALAAALADAAEAAATEAAALHTEPVAPLADPIEGALDAYAAAVAAHTERPTEASATARRIALRAVRAAVAAELAATA